MVFRPGSTVNFTPLHDCAEFEGGERGSSGSIAVRYPEKRGKENGRKKDGRRMTEKSTGRNIGRNADWGKENGRQARDAAGGGGRSQIADFKLQHVNCQFSSIFLSHIFFSPPLFFCPPIFLSQAFGHRALECFPAWCLVRFAATSSGVMPCNSPWLSG